MKCIHKFLVVTLFLFMPLSNAHARTCAEKLGSTKNLLVVGAIASTLIIPVYGFGFVTMGLALYNSKLVDRTISRLNAASIIVEHQNVFETDEMNPTVVKAHKIFNHFYEGLEKKFPDMRLTKNEVVDWLNDVNYMKVGKRACDTLKNISLGRAFFADGKMEEWIKIKEEEVQINLRREEAAAYRLLKNGSFLKKPITDEIFIDMD